MTGRRASKNGPNLCRGGCGTELPDRRYKWCGDGCYAPARAEQVSNKNRRYNADQRLRAMAALEAQEGTGGVALPRHLAAGLARQARLLVDAVREYDEAANQYLLMPERLPKDEQRLRDSLAVLVRRARDAGASFEVALGPADGG